MKVRENLITLEFLNRKIINKNELKNKILKSIKKSHDKKKELYMYTLKKLLKQNKKQFFSRLKNRCHETGRLKSYISFCGLSRHMTKKNSKLGKIQNLKIKS
jgi:ribosomal protein S14